MTASQGAPGATRRWRGRGLECPRAREGPLDFGHGACRCTRGTRLRLSAVPLVGIMTAAPGTDASVSSSRTKLKTVSLPGTQARNTRLPSLSHGRDPLQEPSGLARSPRRSGGRKQKQVRLPEARVPARPTPACQHAQPGTEGGDGGGRRRGTTGVILSGNRPLQVSLVKLKCSRIGLWCGQTHRKRPCDHRDRDWGYAARSRDHLQPQTLGGVGGTLP